VGTPGFPESGRSGTDPSPNFERESMSHGQADDAGPGSIPPRRTPEVEILSRIGIPGRMLLLALVLAFIYGAVRALTHILFAPDLAVMGLVLPGEPVSAGDTVTLGAVVRNQGAINGAGFVVAVLPGGVELEGPMRVVAPGDTATLPVEVVASSGGSPVALVAFDGWRGVRRLRTWRSVPLQVAPRTFDAEQASPAGFLDRGRVATFRVHWSNPGPVEEAVRLVAVVRPESGGSPRSTEGLEARFGPGDEGILEVGVDSWSLPEGRHQVAFHVVSQGERVAGRGARSLVLEVLEP
jgi:hypothetical protein